jgi:hypothetical protein
VLRVGGEEWVNGDTEDARPLDSRTVGDGASVVLAGADRGSDETAR